MSSSSQLQSVISLCEGNSGALSALIHCRDTHPDKIDTVLDVCKTLNLKGSRLWIAYKHYCKYDVPRFIQILETPAEHPQMLKFINDKMAE